MARIVTNSNLSYSAKYRIFNAISLNMRYSFYIFHPFLPVPCNPAPNPLYSFYTIL